MTTRPIIRLLLLATALLPWPTRVHAQETMVQQCSARIAEDGARRFCNQVVQAIEIGQPRLGLALSGGNPLPGASSTLGMRLGSVPRLSLTGRLTAVLLELPPIERQTSASEIKAAVPALNLDASVGLLSGWSLLPTVGGFGSLDLVASAGMIPIPENEGFGDGPRSWAVGARLGLLRESFTAPGVSVTALYRKVGDIVYGDSTFRDEHAFFRMSDLNVVSVRGIIGKRLLFLGASAGFGYDKYKSDVAFGVRAPALTNPACCILREAGFSNDRKSAFAGLQFTFVILTMVGELGWQSGGDAFTAPLPSGQTSRAQKGTYFGSFALRLSI